MYSRFETYGSSVRQINIREAGSGGQTCEANCAGTQSVAL